MSGHDAQGLLEASGACRFSRRSSSIRQLGTPPQRHKRGSSVSTAVLSAPAKRRTWEAQREPCLAATWSMGAPTLAARKMSYTRLGVVPAENLSRPSNVSGIQGSWPRSRASYLSLHVQWRSGDADEVPPMELHVASRTISTLPTASRLSSHILRTTCRW